MKTTITISSEKDDAPTTLEAITDEKPATVLGDPSRFASLVDKRSIRVSACVYCGSEEDLTDEHVIPYAWGGNLQIHDGACERCRECTSRFENFALNDGSMPTVRQALRLQSRSKHKSASRSIKVILAKDCFAKEAEIEASQAPLVLGFPQFSKPRRLAGAGDSPLSLEGWVTTAFGQDIDTFMCEQNTNRLQVHEARKHPVQFAQTIAKIAYTYGCVDGVFEFISGSRDLVSAFMNEPDKLGGFVGTKPSPYDVFSGMDFRLEYALKASTRQVYMEVQPFSSVPAPTYLVVLGTCEDLRAWRRVRQRINSGFESGPTVTAN